MMVVMMMMMMMSKELKQYDLFGSHTFVFQTIQLCTCELDCLRTVKFALRKILEFLESEHRYRLFRKIL
jgi:hypothetical protein